MTKTAIACASGSFKGVFVQGVLKAFEEKGFYADTYAAASSSTLPAAYASIKSMHTLDDLDYWIKMYNSYQTNGFDIARAILDGIEDLLPLLKKNLPLQSTEFIVGLSEVINQSAAIRTQGDEARMLGKELLIATRKKDNSWAMDNLAKRFASTKATNGEIQITENNYKAILYATTRMLHAWKYPAIVENKPMIDASYTCSCAALEMHEKGFDRVIAILPEAGPAAQNFFNTYYIEDHIKDKDIHLIRPPYDLKTIGVDYLKVSPKGFQKAYDLGIEMGQAYLSQNTSI